MQNKNIRRLVESALLIAMATVLSEIKISWLFGGGVTICSMLPLVFLAYRHGFKWGVFSALAYSLIQLLLGLDNFAWVPNPTAFKMVLVALFDYLLAYTAIGFAGCFRSPKRDERLSLVIGIVVTFSIRFLCHVISGLFLWADFAWAGIWTSVSYNGSYMLPEIVISSLIAWLSYKPLEKYWLGKDL